MNNSSDSYRIEDDEALTMVGASPFKKKFQAIKPIHPGSIYKKQYPPLTDLK